MKALQGKKWLLIVLVILGLSIIFTTFIQIQKQTKLVLLKSQTELSKQNIIKSRKEFCSPLSQHISLLGNTQQVSAIAFYQGNYFVATSGGLIKYSPSGQKLEQYNNLNGLGENDLTSLATWADKLYIGTRSKGLLVFDGHEFQKYWWPELQTEAISALLNDNSRLLIGTFSGGLLEFDGNKFTEIKIDSQKIKAITWLSKEQNQIYIGTFDNGLWVIEPTKWQHFTTAQGLLSNRVIGVTEIDKNLVIATDFGLSIAPLTQAKSIFQTALILPTLSSITKTQNHLILLQDNGQVSQIALNKGLNNKYLKPLTNIPTNNAHIIELHDQIWLASSNGLWRLNQNNLVAFGQNNPDSLSGNLVSALAIDNSGRLWVGYFRNGIDIFSLKGHKITHLENNYLREVNHISIDQGTVLVATSQGLVSFDSKLNSQRLSKSNGLLNHNISSSYKFPNSNNLLLATAKGLAIGKDNKFSLLTKVQGLPSNNTYSILAANNSIYVATLTGLAQVTNEKVVRTYKDANSNLNTNWITALQLVNNQLFIGTYGGGVYQLMPSGQLHSFVGEVGRLVVNLNAMFSDNERLYIGTLKGLWVYQLDNQRWYQVNLELPSSNVLSITGNNHDIYVGTTNGIAKVDKAFFKELYKE